MSEHKSRYELFLEEEERAAQPTRRCTKCGEVKALSEFYKANTRKVGVVSRCKACSNTPKYKSREDRFWKMYWSKVEKVGECQEWQGYYLKKHPACRWKGKSGVMVRRLVYQLAIAELPNDARVITTCRNSKCVRHSHLRAISKDEMNAILWNTNPMGDANGSRTHPERRPRGNANGSRIHIEGRPRGCGVKNAKLTEDDIPVIRNLFFKEKTPMRVIAPMFGVTDRCIAGVISGRTWAHVQ